MRRSPTSRQAYAKRLTRANPVLPPERLLKALLLIALYSGPSERPSARNWITTCSSAGFWTCSCWSPASTRRPVPRTGRGCWSGHQVAKRMAPHRSNPIGRADSALSKEPVGRTSPRSDQAKQERHDRAVHPHRPQVDVRLHFGDVGNDEIVRESALVFAEAKGGDSDGWRASRRYLLRSEERGSKLPAPRSFMNRLCLKAACRVSPHDEIVHSTHPLNRPLVTA